MQGDRGMKSITRFITFLIAFIAVSLIACEVTAQIPQKAPKKVYAPPEENFGFVPPPMDLSDLQPAPYLRGAMQPPSWDWRTLGGITSVKNQNPYGTCWSFAAIGDLESKVLINESFAPDYSEMNVVACNPHGTTCNSGGNAWMSTNYLALLGSVDELCNPYPVGCPTPSCLNPTCAFLKQITEWRVIPNDVTAIKHAVMNYGPVSTAMYASFPGFSSYDGSYCLTYTGVESPNHALLIVGWDDAMCGGTGGWIVKNSWGTGWGDNGYFYIAYGNARIGEASNVITECRDPNPDERIYYWDDLGWWNSVGYGDGDDWGMVEITSEEKGSLHAIDFWAVHGPASYTMYVYETFNGSSLSDVLAGPITGAVQEAGYYSVPLPTFLLVHAADPVYPVIDFNTGTNQPVPMDDEGPMETGKSFISDNGTNWTALDHGYWHYGDIGIRARIIPFPEVRGCSQEADSIRIHSAYNFPAGVQDIFPGQELTYDFAICMYSTDEALEDTICLHVVGPPDGYDLSGDINEGSIAILTSGCWGYTDIECDLACMDVTVGRPDIDTLILHVVPPPPALVILQDTLSFVEQGVTAAYVPFAVCNSDPCTPGDYEWLITSIGYVGGPISQGGAQTIAGGDCYTVYGIIDASASGVCEYDTLTIVAWRGDLYDTCVQAIHIVEPIEVPLFTTPVVTILILAMILAAAVFLRRRSMDGAL